MAVFCPYCDELIDKQVYQEWMDDYPTIFDFECPKCGKELRIDVEMEPIFNATKNANNPLNPTSEASAG